MRRGTDRHEDGDLGVLLEPRAFIRIRADDDVARDVDGVLLAAHRHEALGLQCGRGLVVRLSGDGGHRDQRTRTGPEPPAHAARDRGEQQDQGEEEGSTGAPLRRPAPQQRRVVDGLGRGCGRARQHHGARHDLGEIRGVGLGALRRRRRGDGGCDAETAFDLPQPLEHLLRVVGAFVRGLLRRPQHEFVELLRHAGIAHAGARHRLGRVLEGDLHGLLALVGLFAHEHLVQHDAERIDVAARIRGAASHELGREIGDRAEELLSGGGVGRRGPRETEVADLDAPVFGEQHVLGLHVAVHDSCAVCGRESGEHGVHDRDRLRYREPLLFAQQLAEGDPRQVLHHQIRQLAVLTLVEDVDDVGVRESRGGARLLDESALEGRIVAQVRVHHLERDAALEAQIGGDIDRRHPTSRDSCTNSVATVDEPPDEGVGLLIGRHVKILLTTA